MNTLFYQPDIATEHLSADVWQKVNLQLLQKMLSEFSHEMLLEPESIAQRGEWSVYAVEHGEKDVQYHFLARILSLDHWDIDALSIIKIHKGSQMPLDAVQFVVEFAEQLGLEQENIGTYIEEVISVLFTYCYMRNKNTTAVEDLVHADYQDMEHNMSAGHPCFVANSARIGFDAIDYQNYAPEAADPLAIVWLAGHCDCTEFSSIADSSYEKMIKQELDEERLASFNQNLLSKDLDPKDYYYFPVHPWQWFNKLAHIFAADIANQKLICLGYADDLYLPQQSVRTLFNVDNRSRSYVKSALSILNMGFMRGLSPNFMRTTPAINTWVYDLVINDDYLQRKGFTVLREFATVGYTNLYFEEALHIDTPYKKMLSTLWRESPFLYVNEEQQMMTMAALLHIDVYGNAFLPTMIKASGLSVQDWLRHYLNCYLSPLLHCYYFHDMRFMPHGENLILVLENHIPVKVIMKDIGEEVAVLSPDVSLPFDVERIRIPVPEDLKILSIFTQAFDCFFRFLNQVLVSHADFPEEQFWQTVSECVLAYQQEFPSLEDRFNRYDLFAAEIPKTCLNRLQLRNNKKMIDGANPFKHQQFAGNLKNPLAVYKTTLI